MDCPACAAPISARDLMGTLGSTTWYRCRYCGMDTTGAEPLCVNCDEPASQHCPDCDACPEQHAGWCEQAS